MEMSREVYTGLLVAVLAASVKKVKIALRYTASGEYQDYPPGVLELGIVLDAIDMVANDILHFVQINAEDI